MTRTSKQKIEKTTWRSIHNQFNKTLLNLKSNNAGQKFLNDLLTESETVMLSKRLSIIFLILEKVPQRKIAEALKVSTSTIRRISYALDHGGFATIQTFFREKKQCQEFWKEISVAIRFGMPAYTGKERWQWLDDIDKKYKTVK